MLALMLLLTAPALAQPVARYRPPMVMLSNGLRVLGYEDRSTSLVGVFLALKVTAGAEGQDLRGARDLLQDAFRWSLEKQMRSDPKYLDLTSALLVGHGLSLGTEWDYLSMLALCPRSELRPLLSLMGQVVFREPLTAEGLAAAQRQVGRQWQIYQTNPAEATYYLFRRSLLGQEGAAQPIYADSQKLDRLTLTALEAFRTKWFVPSNAVLVLAGPDQPEQLVAEAVESLVSAPKAAGATGWPPHFSLQPSSVQMATNPGLRQGDAEIASLIVGYRFPPPADEDYPASLVLYEMLTGTQGALESNPALRQALLAGRLARPGNLDLPMQMLPPLLSAAPYVAVHVQAPAEQVGNVQQALVAAVASVETRLKNPAEVERAKHRALSTQALAGLNQGARARRLGEWALFAQGWMDLRDLPKRLEGVTAADLQRVAKRCLAREYVGLQMPD